MTKAIISAVFFFIFASNCFTQDESYPSTFHRLLIFNDSNEIILVRINNTETWVTPGFYQNHKVHIRQGMDSIVATYGMRISSPKLKGIFTVKSGLNNKISTRLMYVAKMTKANSTMPEIQSFFPDRTI